MNIQQDIQDTLDRLEAERGIRILYACESGSRAWGFPSPNSDYDVRFVYVQPLDWYLSLEKRKDTLDLPVNDLLDVNGWELKKFLQAIHKPNASPFEWLQSPIVYRQRESFREQLWEIAPGYYNPIRMAYHYQSLARNSRKAGKVGRQINIKKYFYVLRPVLALKWILERQTVPPMEFEPLRAVIADRPGLNQVIDELLIEKEAAPEKALTAPRPELEALIEEVLDLGAEGFRHLPSKTDKTDKLNEFFVHWVRKEELW